MGDLGHLVLLDADLYARGGVEVQAGRRHSSNELDTVVARQHGKCVCGQLICRVTVSIEAISNAPGDSHQAFETTNSVAIYSLTLTGKRVTMACWVSLFSTVATFIDLD